LLNKEEPQSQEIVKSDKPKVELFVMTHCPFGTQAEKGMIPVYNELGNLIDAKIRFVHYFMHDPEEAETPRQVCIREEQPDKFIPYLECFLEEGDNNKCITEAKIDTTKLNDCISKNAENYYKDDSELSEGYGVQGSPSLIINGKMVNSARDSQSYLKIICSAFNTPPEICNTAELSSQSPSPGFGYGAGPATTASCG
jgi:protein-disulfide isomerase